MQISETLECLSQNSRNSCHFLKQQISFSSNVASLFSVMRDSSSVLIELKIYILSTKGAYQSTNLEKFHMNSQKSEVLHFERFLLSK